MKKLFLVTLLAIFLVLPISVSNAQLEFATSDTMLKVSKASNIYDIPDKKGNIIYSLSKNQPVIVDEELDTYYHISSPYEGYVLKKYITTPTYYSSPKYIYATADAVRGRDVPYGNDTSLRTKLGKKYEYYAKWNNFYLLNISNKLVWVYGGKVDGKQYLSSTDSVCKAVVKSNTCLRAMDSSSSKTLAKLKKDTKIYIIPVSSNWCLVNYNGTKGYVLTSCLKKIN